MLRFNKQFLIISILLFFSTNVSPKVEYLDFLDGVDVEAIEEALRKPNPDSFLSTIELIDKYGYNAEKYNVVTNDKHVLEMHRISGPKNNSNPEGKPAVLLMHGILGSSADWILSGPGRALGYILADAGYDVWLGNARGNTYCRNHLIYSPKEKAFWDFSWHEIGVSDLPSMIDKILEVTGNKKIYYIGYSQGATSFFAMTSELPEYNHKIISMHALAPVGYCKNLRSSPLRFLSKIDHQIELVMKFLGMYEITLTTSFYKKFTSKLCHENSVLQPICNNILFLLGGFNPSHLNMTLLPVILGHTPAGSSTMQLLHYSQLTKNYYFRQYDHGLFGNLKKYGKFKPPHYDLSEIITPVFVYYAVNDGLTHPKDVDKLYSQLGNAKAKVRISLKKFNHLDFLWAKDVDTLLYKKIVNHMSL